MPRRGEAGAPVGDGFAADAGMTATAPTAATSARAAVSLRGTGALRCWAGVPLPSPFGPEFLPVLGADRVRRVRPVGLWPGEIRERRFRDDLRHGVAVPAPSARGPPAVGVEGRGNRRRRRAVAVQGDDPGAVTVLGHRRTGPGRTRRS